MGKKYLIGFLIGLVFLGGELQAAENTDLVGTVITAPVVWSGETLIFSRDLMGIPFGWNGDPQENWNYTEQWGNESAYRFNRWGVN